MRIQTVSSAPAQTAVAFTFEYLSKDTLHKTDSTLPDRWAFTGLTCFAESHIPQVYCVWAEQKHLPQEP